MNQELKLSVSVCLSLMLVMGFFLFALPMASVLMIEKYQVWASVFQVIVVIEVFRRGLINKFVVKHPMLVMWMENPLCALTARKREYGSVVSGICFLSMALILVVSLSMSIVEIMG
jgi:hypothetical protein